MLIEGLVGVVALIAACSLSPGDYFAINVSPQKFATLGASVGHIEELPVLEAQVGEKVEGRTGGAVSLAIGMAKIFSALPGMGTLMAYWYHFAIMFEALFILTTIDTGTRVARFVVQEFIGKVYKPADRVDWVPGTVLSSLFVVAAWSYFIYTGNVSTIWPMFGIANQILAVLALCVATAVLINTGKVRYIWTTVLPMSFVIVTTTTAAYQLIFDNFLPLTRSGDASAVFRGYLNIIMTVVMIGCVTLTLIDALTKWFRRDRLAASTAAD
jgi:carbon starvation protein